MNVSTDNISDEQQLRTCLDETFAALDRVMKEEAPQLKQREVGIVHFVGQGIVRVGGLPNVRSEEIVRLSPGDLLGYVFNVDPDEVGVILLGPTEHITAGSEVRRTGRVMDVPVGEDLLGRVVDALGRPLDNLGEIRALRRLPVEREAPPVMARSPVTVPLQTGLKVVDALIPIGRGQRELILGDRQTGKTAIALDTIINQRGKDVICIYNAIGKKASDVAKVVADLREQKRHVLFDRCGCHGGRCAGTSVHCPPMRQRLWPSTLWNGGGTSSSFMTI